MTTKRTDIHRPSAPEFDPADYEFRGCYDLCPEYPDTFSGPERIRQVNVLIGEGYSFGNAPHGMGQCSHCGASIRYAALMTHPTTRTMLYIGETCLDNRFELSKGEFQALRTTAKLNRERRTKLERVETALAEMGADVRAAYDWAMQYDHCDDRTPRELVIAHDIASKVEYYSQPLSEKQEEFLVKLYADYFAKQAEQEERLRKIETGEIESCPTGKIEVTGEILTTKLVDTQFGSTVKMLVQDLRGFKLWGTRPSAICEADRGTQVSFFATIEPKQGDPTFGFFSRPTKARILAV